MKNPFHTDTLEPDQPFCNRVEELSSLSGHARNGMNVVLFAPRRYGKTSLVRRVQHQLRSEGVCVIYAQFMRLVSVDDLVHRLAKAVVVGLHEHESLLDKGKRWLRHLPSVQPVFTLDPSTGTPAVSIRMTSRPKDPLDALESLLEELGALLAKDDFHVCIALDEFQDIVDIKEPRVEALLREHMQRHKASYVFLGSRRRVLVDIFSNKGRPFYHSATMMELVPLPEDECVEFIRQQFAQGGKHCPEDVARKITRSVEQYPYYLQALAYRVFELCEDACTPEHVTQGYELLLGNERYSFQAILQGLSAGQLKLLRGLAQDGQAQLTSTAFLQEYGLTLGGVQSARNALSEQDIIEQLNDGRWRIVDPIFKDWLLQAF